jgi:hypothetical protein
MLLNMFRALQFSSSEARQTAIAASGFCMNVQVEVFSAVVGLLVGRQCHTHCLPTNKPTTAENTSTCTFMRKPEAATAVWRAPDDGHLMPETCWAAYVQQGNKFYNWLVYLVGCFIRVFEDARNHKP